MDMELLVLLGGFAAVGLLGFEVMDQVDRFLDGVRRENGAEEALWVAGPETPERHASGAEDVPCAPDLEFLRRLRGQRW